MPSFEEYKFFAESTQYLSERRQESTKTYLGVNTAIFAVFGFFLKSDALSRTELALVALPLILVGIFACVIWRRIIVQYRELIGWRYDQLQNMEQEIRDSYQMYIKEWKEFFEPRQSRKAFGFSRLEVRLPGLFIFLYFAFVVALVLIKLLA